MNSTSQQFPVADARHPAERSGIRKLAAGAAAAPEIYAELAATDEASARIVESYLAAVDRARAWSSLSLAPFLAARN